MNKCKNCNVNVYESEKYCPLCFTAMENVKESIVEYPKYIDIIKDKSPLRNLPLFIATTAIILCIYINIFTYNEGETIWSIIVVSAISYLVAMVRILRNSSRRYASKILCSYLLLSALVIIIDLTTGMNLWSLNYVYPFLTLATVAYLTILAVQSKRYFSEYFGYILAVTTIDIFSTIFELLIFQNMSWGVFITVISSLIVSLALYLFADKSLKDEVKKRFHR